jgi:hypothetical protein
MFFSLSFSILFFISFFLFLALSNLLHISLKAIFSFLKRSSASFFSPSYFSFKAVLFKISSYSCFKVSTCLLDFKTVSSSPGQLFNILSKLLFKFSPSSNALFLLLKALS